VSAERGDAAGTESRFIFLRVVDTGLLAGIAVRQQRRDQHRTGRQHGAFDIAAAQPQEVIIGDAVSL
jgi:hypothetical protein